MLNSSVNGAGLQDSGCTTNEAKAIALFLFDNNMSSESLFKKCAGCNKDIAKNISACPYCNKKQNTVSFMAVIGVVFLLIVFFNLLKSSEDQNNPAGGEVGRAVVTEKYEKTKIAKHLDLKYSWSKSGFGSVMEADFVISNNSDMDVKDLEIQCDHYGKSGTKIDSNNRAIYDQVKAGGKKELKDFNMGFIHEQATTTSCKIIDFGVVN